MAYNGWTNRATWLVNVWFNPESKEDVAAAREHLDEEFSKLSPLVHDFIDADINWDELESHFKDEENEDDEEEQQ
jgi:hypothetical protein